MDILNETATALQGNSFATTEQTTDLFSNLTPAQLNALNKPYFTRSKNSLSFENDHYDISIKEYIEIVTNNKDKAKIEELRALKRKGETDDYRNAKIKMPAISAHSLVQKGKGIKEEYCIPNGLICIDIDEYIDSDTFYRLSKDEYTYIIHRSIGGDGVCIFIKIDAMRDLTDTYNALEKHFKTEFDVVTDKSCKNLNRTRILSFDNNLVFNPSSKKFTKVFREQKFIKDVEKKLCTNYSFNDDDLNNAITEIRNSKVSIAESYEEYCNLPYAIYSRFQGNEEGLELFKLVCSYSDKYNEEQAATLYNSISKDVKENNRSVPFDYFFVLCNRAGLNIHTEKTETILKAVAIGKHSFDEVKEYCKNKNIEVTDRDSDFIQKCIDKAPKVAKQVSYGTSEIGLLTEYILNNYKLYRDEISNIVYCNGKSMNDRFGNDIYLNASDNFDFSIRKDDVYSIVGSSKVQGKNALKDFLEKAKDDNDEHDYIKDLAECFTPYNEKYTYFVFKKWLVGAVNNFLRENQGDPVSDTCLVLTGNKQGTGKTHTLRHLLPKELRKYQNEMKLKVDDKDSLIRLASSLLIIDDEFNGAAFKNKEEFKAICSKDSVTLRKAYGRNDDTYIRKCALCGTSNEIELIKDTDNRRILPVNVESIDWDKFNDIDKDKLWIQAYKLFQSGFDYTVNKPEDKKILDLYTEENRYISPTEQTFFKYFSFERTEDKAEVAYYTDAELEQILKREYTPFNSLALKDIKRRFNVKLKPHKGVRKWRVYFNKTDEKFLNPNTAFNIAF